MTSRKIPQSDEDLLAECEVQTFRSSGPGGQNVNRRATAVRLRHKPTGITVVCQDQRSQAQNKQLAIRQMRRKLQERFRRRKPRIPTKVPRAARRHRLEEKRRQSQKKQLRRRPGRNE